MVDNQLKFVLVHSNTILCMQRNCGEQVHGFSLRELQSYNDFATISRFHEGSL